MKRILFITGNLNKLQEAREILKEYEIDSYNIKLPELQGSIKDIITHKAKYASRKLNKTIIVEDTSLCFTAINDLPGPYIKDFITKLGNKKLPLLLKAFKDKRAKAICSIGYCEPKKEPKIFQGTTYGTIVNPKGRSKFGWDPIFKPNRKKQTFAEMTKNEKNAISHRRKALEKLNTYLLKKQ